MVNKIDFAEWSANFLRVLFDKHLDFPVSDVSSDYHDSSFGFEIYVTFLDDMLKKRQFYFIYEDFKAAGSWTALQHKIHLFTEASRPVDAFIILSPYVDISNGNLYVNDKLRDLLHCPVQFWMPGAHVREYFSLEEGFFRHWYDEPATPSQPQKNEIRQALRNHVLDMLKEKDHLPDNTAEADALWEPDEPALKLDIIVHTLKSQVDTVVQRTAPKYPKKLTMLVPTLPPDLLIGREKTLQKIRTLLTDNHAVVVTNRSGGIGKTALVQAYVHLFENKYKHIAWVTQCTSNLLVNIINADGLIENLSITPEGKSIETLFREIMVALESMTDGPNLFVIDGADKSLAKFQAYLPRGPRWHLLATSHESISGFKTLPLKVLSPTHSRALYNKYAVTSSLPPETIDTLLKAIRYHPLTVRLFAHATRRPNHKSATIKHILTNALVNQDPQNKTAQAHTATTSIWLLYLYRATAFSRQEIWLLKHMVCLPPGFYSYDFLEELLLTPQMDQDLFSYALHRLTDSGWLLHNESTDSYKLHTMVREVCLVQAPPQVVDVETYIEEITQKVLPPYDTVELIRWIPFGHAVITLFFNTSAPAISRLLYNLAAAYQHIGDYSTQRNLLRKKRRKPAPANPSQDALG